MADAPLPFSVESSRFRSYPEYKDSGVEWLGEIPTHWEVAALRYRYEQSLGKMLDTKRITGDHLIPYLRNVDVQWDHINCLDLPSMDIRPHEIERYTVRPGDLLVCEGGEAGRSAIWRGELVTCGYQKALHRLRPLDRGRERPRFLYYTLAVAVTRRAFVDGQGSTIAHLTGDMLRAHRFPFPPTTEQHAIADFLDRETPRINVQIAKQEGLIELLQEKRTALLRNAVTEGLDADVAMKESGVEWLGQIPAHWEVAALRYRYEQSLGKMLDTKRITGDHLTPYLRNVDVQWDHINVSDLPSMDIGPHEIERFTVRPRDLLVCEGGEAGRCAIWRGELGTCGYQKALHRLRPLDGGRDRPRFLYYTLAVAVTRGAFADGRGSTITHLTGDMLRAHRFPFPPTAEQHSIADLLDRETAKIDAMVGKVNEAIDCLEEYRTALISAAVTGKIDVRQEPEHMVTTGHTPTSRSRQ